MPYIFWQFFFSDILSKHQRVKDTRVYIWKSRKVIFRKRIIFFIFHTILSLILATLCFKLFGNNTFEEIIVLLLLTIVTLSISIVQWYFYSKRFIRYTNKMKDHKIYSRQYIQSLEDEKVQKKSLITDNEKSLEGGIYSKSVININNQISVVNQNSETKSNDSTSITIHEDDYFKPSIVEYVHKQCNGIVFQEDNINKFYNNLNLKSDEEFKIYQKGRFLSLVYLLQSTIPKRNDWEKKFIAIFGIDYENYYVKNRLKKFNEKDFEDANKRNKGNGDLKDKIKFLLTKHDSQL